MLLSRADLVALLTPADYFAAVENAFRAARDGRATAPLPLHIKGKNGSFHAKGASLDSGRNYVALKFNGNFPGNRERAGLPTIQGAVLLCDADNGALLALFDSIEITLRRTGAASALAAKHLASKESRTLAIVGCGDQARPQAEAIAAVFALNHAFCFDTDHAKSVRFAAAITRDLSFPFEAVRSFGDATRVADIIITCTTSREPFLEPADVRPGTFIAAVGADSSEKSEIAPRLMSESCVVTDSTDQCAVIGDLHHALDGGAMTRDDVYAELADIVCGVRPARTDAAQVFIFDSTGTALQDVASAALAYESARRAGLGHSYSLD